MKIALLTFTALLAIVACKNNTEVTTDSTTGTETKTELKYPSDVIPFMDKYRILLGDGIHVDDLVNYQDDDFYHVENDATPNFGITSRTSSNTRIELGEKKHWFPEQVMKVYANGNGGRI